VKKSSAFLFCLLAACSLRLGNADASGEPPDRSPALPSKKRILDCVTAVTGLDAISPVEKSELVSLSEVIIPFFSSELKDKIGIRVRMAPVTIKWSSTTGPVADHYTRYFTVYLDADAERVLAVTSRLAERPPDIREPTADETEGELRGSAQIYSSFPSAAPKITFMQALGAVREPLAPEIDGVYVMYSHLEEKPHPVWAISMRGGPPSALSFSRPILEKGVVAPEAPAGRQRNFVRAIVDATTGTPLISTFRSEHAPP